MFSINRIRQNASRTVIAVYFDPIFETQCRPKWDLMQIRLVKWREVTVNLLILVYFGITVYKTNNECFYSCNGKNIFIP